MLSFLERRKSAGYGGSKAKQGGPYSQTNSPLSPLRLFCTLATQQYSPCASLELIVRCWFLGRRRKCVCVREGGVRESNTPLIHVDSVDRADRGVVKVEWRRNFGGIVYDSSFWRGPTGLT